LALAGCGWGGTPPSPTPPVLPPATCAKNTPLAAGAGYAYVCVQATGIGNYIQSYVATSNGTNTGHTAYVLPTGGACGRLTGDGAGTLYQVVEGTPDTNITVLVLAANSGTLNLLRSFTATLGSEEIVPAADQSGNLYLQEADNTLVKFDAQASGPATPVWTLPMSAGFSDMATDSSGNLYAAQANSILEFPAGFSTAAPSKTMDVSASAPDGITAIGLDNCSNLAITTSSPQASIIFFPPAVDGTESSTRTIQGGTNFVQPTDVFIDSTGVTTIFDGNFGGSIDVLRYADGAQGKAAPISHYFEGLGQQHPNRSTVY
jgi:hypothetical protein